MKRYMSLGLMCAVLLLGMNLVSPSIAEETVKVHPVKQLAIVQADAEIALREAKEVASASEKTFQARRDRLNGQPDQVRRVIDEVRRREEAKPDENRSQMVFDNCNAEVHAIEDLRAGQQESLRDAEVVHRKAMERLNHLQESFNHAGGLGEHWKDADLPLESLSAVYAAIEAESKKVTALFSKVESELAEHLETWAKQVEKTRTALGAAKAP